MRTATVRISPDAAGLHPVDAEIAAHPDVERAAVDNLTELDDGSAVLLCRLRGDGEAVESILDDSEDVLDHHLTASGQTTYAHLHVVPTEPAAALLRLRRTHRVVVQLPLRWRADGSLEVSAVGSDRALQRAIEAIPESVGVELVEIRSYDPAPDGPADLLTDRQLEVLDAALEVGYYEEPREGTQADVAAVVDLAPATVGEHLRRIEGKVMRSLRE